jgi:hypothetical protein
LGGEVADICGFLKNPLRRSDYCSDRHIYKKETTKINMGDAEREAFMAEEILNGKHA